MLPSSSALVGGLRHGGVLQPVQASAAPQVPPETASRVAALCNTSSTLFDTEGAHAPPASPQLAMPDPAHAASGAVALQKEVEALRDECKQLESVTVSMRAAMLTLVTEVDALGVADKRAESELNAAKARATLASQRADYEKKAQDHQKLLAYELQIEELEQRLNGEFIARLEELEEKMETAHRDLEVVLLRYADPASKAVRKAESAAVEKLSLKLERTQDKIDAAKRRKLCMQIAFAEVTSGKTKPGAA